MSVDEVSGRRPGAQAGWNVIQRRERLLFGSGRLRELGDLVREIGGTRALIVTDPGIREAGHVDTALESLRGAGVEAAVFDGVEENPTTAHVERGAAVARAQAVDFLVGLGGGSAMDCAKGINFLATNGGCMEDYRGFNRASRPMLSSVGVPSTAGTGSEGPVLCPHRTAEVAHQDGLRRRESPIQCGDHGSSSSRDRSPSRSFGSPVTTPWRMRSRAT